MPDERAEAPHFRLLGSPQVIGTAGEPVKLAPGRQPIVLAALLLAPHRAVGMDHLIDLVWPLRPPATARTQIQICVSALRKELAAAGHAELLRTCPPGYVMEAGDSDVDHRLFESLLTRARERSRDVGGLREAADLLQSALALWRGPALDGVACDGLRSSIAQLEELRASALGALVDVRMRLGEHERVVPDLRRLVEDDPLRERWYLMLMTALHRAGRRAEALEVYQAARNSLVDQLGVEPGVELRTMHAEVLDGTASVEPASAGSSATVPARVEPLRTVVTTDPTAGADAEPAPVAASAPPDATLPTPFQLPADSRDFGSREAECDVVRRALTVVDRTAVPVVVLVGTAGVGKSALAVHIAHQLRDHHPDGQLYCELGMGGLTSASVSEMLARFARALGAPSAMIPDGEAERAQLYRSLTADRRVLVVLEDAVSESQVSALIPGSAGCAVIVTSRSMLTGLPGATVVELEALDPAESRTLLARVIGEERIEGDPATSDALVRMVGGLPLALRIVGARLAARPRWPLTVMLNRLLDEGQRLDELAHGDMMVRASLSMSYDGLAPEAGRLLRLLSVIEADSYPVWLAAALLDSTEVQAEHLLETLVDVHLLDLAALDVDGTPRYRLSVIIRLYARERLHEAEAAADRLAALQRAAGACLAMIGEVHRRVYGGEFIVLHGASLRRAPEQPTIDRLLTEPLLWLAAERPTVCAVIDGTAAAGPAVLDACWDLAVSMVDLFESGAYQEVWAATHEIALAATRRGGHRRGEAALLTSLGTLALTEGRLADAWGPLQRAAEVFRDLQDTAGTALAERELAWADRMAGDDAGAARRYREVLTAFEAADDPIGRAHVLRRLAEITTEAGDTDESLALLDEALTLARSHRNPRVETQVLFEISNVWSRQGRFADAESLLDDLLGDVRDRRDAIGEARILERLGSARMAQGDAAGAAALLRDAVAVRERTLDVAGADELRAELRRAEAAAR